MRVILSVVDAALANLSPASERLFAPIGQHSIPRRACGLCFTSRRPRPHPSDEHFPAQGRDEQLAWGRGRHAEREFHGEKRTDGRASTSGADARLCR